MWFNTSQGQFGFVVGETDMGERKLYAGVCDGRDQRADEQTILSWGNKVNIGLMEGLIAKTKKEAKCSECKHCPTGGSRQYNPEKLRMCPDLHACPLFEEKE